MRKLVLVLVLLATLAGCTEIKSSKYVTGKAVVEGKNTEPSGLGGAWYRIYARVDGELVMWHVMKDEYEATSVGDTMELYHVDVFTIREK